MPSKQDDRKIFERNFSMDEIHIYLKAGQEMLFLEVLLESQVLCLLELHF